MVVVRKLESILRELEPLADQGKVKGFFNNVANADRLGGLVEDIRDAVMDYQVCKIGTNLPPPGLTTISDFVTARHLRQELSTDSKPRFLIV